MNGAITAAGAAGMEAQQMNGAITAAGAAMQEHSHTSLNQHKLDAAMKAMTFGPTPDFGDDYADLKRIFKQKEQWQQAIEEPGNVQISKDLSVMALITQIGAPATKRILKKMGVSDDKYVDRLQKTIVDIMLNPEPEPAHRQQDIDKIVEECVKEIKI